MKSFLLKILSGILLPTLRITFNGEEHKNTKAVYIFWHGKMFCGWWIFRHSNSGALISKSKDGELLASLLDSWGFKLFRGSSSSEGKLALESIVDNISDLSKVVITPDGPRGPARKLKNGVLSLSLKTGLPIVPVKIYYKSKKTLKSWDSFEIPYPFSRVEITFGEPISYEKFLTGPELDAYKFSLEEQMK